MPCSGILIIYNYACFSSRFIHYRLEKWSGDKSYNALFNISPFFAPWYGLLHFLGQFADIGGTAHVKGLRDPLLRHAGLFRDDVR